ncbi:bifunctional 3-(3-hydroxy-phenyl)propionate/3-hydroxycinnamic acid hydroxylase [Bacillus sp. ISL-75]|uniref:bifunctional 3-(3-hydroxy-phenyl)propionate/3-hydroxycinnamic acid hydroxylase MhpA n=1 Tax=Bacillus sp. ISL-75 TaxID=2819137 RepID=UPI001BE4FB82|nr:bifunctional 3-(3-hydroxy-phenyl)propionate/3-hydroxycinnamic acid hydroxylase [Bacillus sp. ISL-75]MBT2730930.1 bifunctional 3-(3-hydroxy-phenyl)propionate/3-hydroxycinnamic acid hydroxylase [Bacillus sp. ISL-75]
MRKENVDVAIVGYGPVAKLLGTLIGQKGWKVGVYERFSEPYPLPRAVKLDHEIARLLQSVVPTDVLKKVLQPVHDYYEWQNADRVPLIKLDWSQFGISGWHADMFFCQPDLEAMMDVTCREQETVNVNLGMEAIQLKEFNDHVELIVKDLDGEETIIHAKYVVGCDGANSFVRAKMEHTMTDLDFNSDFLVVDIIPNEERTFSPMNLQLCDPVRPTTVVSGGYGRRRWEFMIRPGESKEEFKTEENVWKLLEPWDITPKNAILERHALYTFRARWADNWRKGRVMIAGDAAHLTPPFMGQGMCSGLRDSANLAWKLDLILRGNLNDNLLETYTEERKPHNQRVVEAAIYLGNLICVADPKKAEERDQAFLNGDAPPFPEFPILRDGFLHQPEVRKSSNLAGQLSLQSEVKYQGKTGLFDDVVGTGWMVISQVSNPKNALNDEQIEFLEDIGATFIEIANSEIGTNVVVDVNGKYYEYFKQNQIEAVIVRPDFYHFGSVATFSELTELVEDLRNQLKKFMNTAAMN